MKRNETVGIRIIGWPNGGFDEGKCAGAIVSIANTLLDIYKIPSRENQMLVVQQERGCPA